MSYEELKEEYIRIKKEELGYINEISIIGNERELSEYEILTIYRKLTDFTKKINAIFDKMQRYIFLERCKLREEDIFSKDSVVLEFDVDKDFLSTLKNENERNWILEVLWIDPKSSKFRLRFNSGRCIPFNIGYVIRNKNNFKPFYLSCGICDTSDDITCSYICGIYYYLEYGIHLGRNEEIPVNEIEEFEKNYIIIHDEIYVDPQEVKEIFDEEFLNKNNKSFDDVRRSTEERIHELSHSRYLSTKKKVLWNKVNDLYEKVEGKLLSCESIYKGSFLEIQKEVYKLPNKIIVSKEKVVKNGGKDAVIVIAITEDKKIIITMQNRFSDKRITEFPSGYIEDGESPIEAAKRELLEETGYDIGNAFILDEALTSPGIDNSTTYIVIANHCIKTSEIKNNGDEFVTYGLFNDEELKYLIDDHIMNGAMNKLAYYSLVNNTNYNDIVYDGNIRKGKSFQKKRVL